MIVPSSSDSGKADVADWVFERGPAELKAAMKSAQKKREQSEVGVSTCIDDIDCPHL